MTKILLILGLITSLAIASCPSNYDLQNFQAGNVYFTTSSKSASITTEIYEYNFMRRFENVPSVAYSIQSMRANSIIVNEWAIKTHNISNTKLNIGFKHQPAQWSLIKTGFWASGRVDVMVGAMTANLGSLKQTTKSFYINFTAPLTNFDGTIMRVFLSGYAQKSGIQIFIRAYDKSLTAYQAELAIQVGGSMQISQAQLNYIIFNPKTSTFASYGGGISQLNMDSPKLYNIQKVVHYSQYRFYGIANLRQSNNVELALTIDVDDEFYLRFTPYNIVQEIYISYLVIGVSPIQTCRDCGDQLLVYGLSCQKTCPAGSYLVNYKDGGKGCRVCPKEYNMTANNAGNGCTCKTGYIQKRGYCTLDEQIPSSVNIEQFIQNDYQSINQIQNNLQSLSSYQNSISLAKNSQSSSNNAQIQQYSPNLRAAETQALGSNLNSISVSTTNQVKVTDKPVYGSNINAPSTIINDNKSPINNGLPNSIINLTMTTYTSNTSNIIENSTANYNTQNITNSYIPSLINTINNNAAISAQNYQTTQHQNIQHNNNDVPQSYIPFITVNNLQNTQNIEYQYVVNDCSAYPNTYWNGYTCICRVGYTMVSSTCMKIQSNFNNVGRPAEFLYKQSLMYFDNDICNEENEQYKNGQCMCKVGWERRNNKCVKLSVHDDNNKGQNNYGNDWINNLCPFNSSYNQTLNKCICVNGYEMINNVCVGKCKENEIFNPLNNQCKCQDGFAKTNGLCLPCNSGNIDPITQICYECKLNQVKKGNKCGCIDNFGYGPNNLCVECDSLFRGYLSDGNCNICPDNANYINGTCKCLNGMNLINNICISVCKPDQLLDSQGNCYYCLINQQVYSGKCVCKKDYARINGVCQLQCPYGTVQIEGKCGQCPGFSVYDPLGKSCVCINGYRLGVEGVCVVSTPPPYWNLLNTTKQTNQVPSSFPSQMPTPPPSPLPSPTNQIQNLINPTNTTANTNNTQIIINQSSNTQALTAYNLSLVSQPYLNQNNVYVILKTSSQYKFSSNTQMKSFIKYEFPDTSTQPSSAYCTQKASDLKTFQCLLIYASGVPNKKFIINFSFQYLQQNGFISVPVDPLSSIIKTRSLK